jgi:uncharacterized LabA/DUF88 family protein
MPPFGRMPTRQLNGFTDTLTETRLKIAVFIDFDNIEIGVKTTLGQQFDISVILEAIKERGEVITKVAYGDWKRAGDHGRLLSQHAIRMVQRNLTPGGDKNGADINLALDALEMAFTHAHINAFVIVGGDSDFITLVEKLKQYDRKVFVVGGRQFTSLVMQKNCHEFIAYENLVSSRGRQSSGGERKSAQGSAPADVAKALPLVKRALKVLADREVSPQLGLLKSTLLQLDSTFSERDYGASTFRDFIEKVAQTGIVTLRHVGRSLLVDLADDGTVARPEVTAVNASSEFHAAASEPAEEEASAAPAPPAVATIAPDPDQAVQRVREIFAHATQTPRWPMYVRQVKQFLRANDEGFDERKLGFGSIVDVLRAAQREALFRLERDRQGVLRVFPGVNLLQKPQPAPSDAELDAEAVVRVAAARAAEMREGFGPMAESLAEAEEAVLTGNETPSFEGSEVLAAAESQPEGQPDAEAAAEPPASRGRRARKTPGPKTARKTPARTAAPRQPRARKKAPTS